jgi:predicted glycogen debranching enzyme
MDARVGDWIVTPRRGKAVEINALWYNALRLMEAWTRWHRGSAAARHWRERAERARESFNARFWDPARGFLRDVVDGDPRDAERLRPNQLMAVSLPHPALAHERWEAVVETVRRELLTPRGLRTLARGDPDYRARYAGAARERDSAYHQGTVWPWLLGPFVDAWLKVHPGRREEARGFLLPLASRDAESAIGTVPEIYDAEPPFAPRGCVAQAWSVAELLRAWIKTEPRD